MKEKIIIIDDFYDTPYQYHKSFSENHFLITNETIEKLTSIVGNKIEIIDTSNEILREGQSTSVCAHLSSDWIALIYLSLPLNSFGEYGVKFYSHLSTGLESFPTKKDLEKYDISENQLLEVFSNSSELWKEYGNIPIKYNRLVLLRSNFWHSYGCGFGMDLNTSMLFQRIFIRDV